MDKDANLVERTSPSYQVLKYVGAGASGQVFKVLLNNSIVACKQIQTSDPQQGLAEHRNMASVKGGPYMATVHDDLEWNPRTNTLSFFMDYYKGKDLDRVVHVLRASGKWFTETQVLDIGCQLAMALSFCHDKAVLHQDINPMNVLLKEPWNPILEPIVPELYVDVGAANRVHSVGAPMTAQRGAPAYQAPEIRNGGPRAEFSPESDIFALGCSLYRLCTLGEPNEAAGIKPMDISSNYSVDLLCVISSMLSPDREDRPTASQAKHQLLELIRRYFDPAAKECRVCRQVFLSRIELRDHLRKTKHNQPPERTVGSVIKDEKGPVALLERITYGSVVEEEEDHTPCAVCMKHFNSKKRFFQHLHCGHHWRDPDFVLRRFFEMNPDFVPKKSKKRRIV